MSRHDGRTPDALREVKIETGFLKHATGSALISCGDTRILCTASIDERTPGWLHGTGAGWVTGEYAMIPAATDTRKQREVTRGRPSGRTYEIQRLIGRALRSVVDRKALGERTLWVDCEVLQADGGTRTASITGGYVAMALALAKLKSERALRTNPLTGMLAAVSVGLVEGRAVLDLDYVEDSSAEVDFNVAKTDDGRYVEVQGTAEANRFSREQLDALLNVADVGIEALLQHQKDAIGSALDEVLAR